MIHYLCTRRWEIVIRSFLATHGRGLAEIVRPLAYEDLFRRDTAMAGTWIFADLERLEPARAEAAVRIWNALARSAEPVRLLNHPTRILRRYELLRRLRQSGANAFDVYRATEARSPERYPVFIRDLDEHEGNLTPLLSTPEELAKALGALEERGRSRESLLIVGFCDTADANGIYRKYSSFYVDGRVVPRHVFFGTDWMLRAPDRTDPELLEEERRYVEENPHQEEVRRVFQLARIDYGRIDYALLEGRVQVWEINTHPYVSTPRDAGGSARAPVARHFVAGFEAALRDLDLPAPRRARIRIPWVDRPPGGLPLLAWRLRRNVPRELRKLLPSPGRGRR